METVSAPGCPTLPMGTLPHRRSQALSNSISNPTEEMWGYQWERAAGVARFPGGLTHAATHAPRRPAAACAAFPWSRSPLLGRPTLSCPTPGPGTQEPPRVPHGTLLGEALAPQARGE